MSSWLVHGRYNLEKSQSRFALTLKSENFPLNALAQPVTGYFEDTYIGSPRLCGQLKDPLFPIPV